MAGVPAALALVAGAVDGCFIAVLRADAEADAERVLVAGAVVMAAVVGVDGLPGVDATADGVVGVGVVGTGAGSLPAPYM